MQIPINIQKGDKELKKGYVEPEAEFISIDLTVDILFHSPNESGGTNSGWDWNDDDDDLPGSQQSFYGGQDGLY